MIEGARAFPRTEEWDERFWRGRTKTFALPAVMRGGGCVTVNQRNSMKAGASPERDADDRRRLFHLLPPIP
jgi:hypothetical protein